MDAFMNKIMISCFYNWKCLRKLQAVVQWANSWTKFNRKDDDDEEDDDDDEDEEEKEDEEGE